MKCFRLFFLRKSKNMLSMGFTLFLVFFNYNSFAQLPVSKNDILPYINDLIGRPKSEETDLKLKSFELALKKIHNAGSDFPITINLKYDVFLNREYISEIHIDGPYEKGTYFYPIEIAVGDFEFKNPLSLKTYETGRVRKELMDAKNLFYNRGDDLFYINVEKEEVTPNGITIDKIDNSLKMNYLFHQYKGEKTSPYCGNAPEKNNVIVTGVSFFQDNNKLAALANFVKHFTERAQKRNALTDSEADIYYTHLYGIFKQKGSLGDIREDEEKSWDSAILPYIKKEIQRENAILTETIELTSLSLLQNENIKNDKTIRLLGDYPPLLANHAIFKLNDSTACSGGNCYYREEILKFEFGEFIGKFLNGKAIEGTFRTKNFKKELEYNLYSRYENGIMDSIEFKNKYYSYHAGYNYDTKKWKIFFTLKNKEYQGEMISLDGQTKGSLDDNTINSFVNLYNFTFGLRSYYFLQSENGYGYVEYEDKLSIYYYVTFLWSAVDFKINEDKLVIFSNQKNPAIFKSMKHKESFSFKALDSLELDIIPEYKEYLQLLIDNLFLQKEKYTNPPLFDFNTYQYHMQGYGQILKNFQKIQQGLLEECRETNTNFNRMSGTVTSVIKYANKAIKALEGFFLAFETLQSNSENVDYSKSIQDKIKEWEVYRNKVQKDYLRLQEAVKIDQKTLRTQEERTAYFNKLSI